MNETRSKELETRVEWPMKGYEGCASCWGSYVTGHIDNLSIFHLSTWSFVPPDITRVVLCLIKSCYLHILAPVMPINDNGPNLNALVARTKPQAAVWTGLIEYTNMCLVPTDHPNFHLYSETTEAIRMERELRKIRKKGSEDNLTKFYALQVS